MGLMTSSTHAGLTADAFEVRGEKFLTLRRGPGRGEGVWYLPGGQVERGEDPLVAAVRETREATGLEVESVRLLRVWTYATPEGHVVWRGTRVGCARLRCGPTAGRRRPGRRQADQRSDLSTEALFVAGPVGPQRLDRRLRQVSTSERSHRRVRPAARSITGRGKSSYLRKYVVTLLRCDSPRRSATSCVSSRFSVSTLGLTCGSLRALTFDTRGP
jgi:8-oxo-dGTP pyrophosphatase MutT (NUDIX family)